MTAPSDRLGAEPTTTAGQNLAGASHLHSMMFSFQHIMPYIAQHLGAGAPQLQES